MTVQQPLFTPVWRYKGREGTSSARFSPCKRYRYELRRTWDTSLRPLVACCLNPSTATDLVEDPTVRRLLGFADRWGHGGIILLNIFSFRSTDPKALKSLIKAGEDPVGEENTENIHTVFREYRRDRLLLAWGGHGGLLDRGRDIAGLAMREHGHPECFGLTNNGQPRHPLYIPDVSAPHSFQQLVTERAARSA
jgi:hypothetical protein